MQTKLLGAEKGPFPTFVISKGRKSYVIERESEDEALSYEAIRSFVLKYTSGVLDPVSKSQALPDPEENAKKAVKDVVGLNFRDAVLKGTTDVIVKFYATWCAHCKRFAPVYEEAAKALDGAPVIFAQVDAAENDVPDFVAIQQYPTIALFPGNNKTAPVYFSGERSAVKVIEFVHNHASSKYDLPEAAKDLIEKAKAEEEAAKKKKKEEEEEKKKLENVVDGEEDEDEDEEVVVVVEDTTKDKKEDKTKDEL